MFSVTFEQLMNYNLVIKKKQIHLGRREDFYNVFGGNVFLKTVLKRISFFTIV